MMQPAAEQPLPPSVARVLSTFRALGREEKMQALLHYSKKLEPVPERFLSLGLDPTDVHQRFGTSTSEPPTTYDPFREVLEEVRAQARDL